MQHCVLQDFLESGILEKNASETMKDTISRILPTSNVTYFNKNCLAHIIDTTVRLTFYFHGVFFIDTPPGQAIVEAETISS